MDETFSEGYEQITPISVNGGGSIDDVFTAYNIDFSPEVAGVILLWSMVISLITYIVFSVLLGRVFKRGGVPAWQAWIPVLNSWRLFELGGRQGFWAVLALLPLINVVSAIFMIIAIHNINLKLKYGAGMTVLAIFFPLIWVIIIGISNNEWDDSLGAKSLVPVHVISATTIGQDGLSNTVTQEEVAVGEANSDISPNTPVHSDDSVDNQ